MELNNIVVNLLIFLVLLILSAVFSGSETAFFSLDKTAQRSFRSRDGSGARRVSWLLDHAKELLITILIGNTIVNVSAVTIAAITVDILARNAGFNPAVAMILNIFVVTFLLIILVEISPKVLAFKYNETWAVNVSGFIKLCYIILFPVMKILVVLVDGVAKLFGVEATKVLFNEEELRTLAEIGEQHGALEEEEREMINSIFEFAEKEAHEVMIPRMDMTTISVDATFEETAELVQAKGHSRIPVFEEDVDHIVGILYAKDLIGKTRDKGSIRELVRKAYFVPEGKMISDLLREFQKNNVHMAIVVDEYGGTEGIVTLEDIIEEIVGEIHDEYDQEEVLYKKLENGDTLIAAKMEVEVFNEYIGENLVPEEDDYETIGGFIFDLAGEVPKEGQHYLHQGWKFTVLTVEANRVVRVRISPPDDEIENSSNGNNDKDNSA